MLFLLIFIAVPIVEIAAFIKIGDVIGLWPTIGCIILTAVIGTLVLRQQGLSVLRQAQNSVQNNKVPLDSVIHGAFLLVAGALLLTPGFFTDAVGFILLVPPARTAIAHFLWRHLKGRVHVVHSGPHDDGGSPRSRNGHSGPVIEGEAVEVSTEDPDDAKNVERDPEGRHENRSPWNR